MIRLGFGRWDSMKNKQEYYNYQKEADERVRRFELRIQSKLVPYLPGSLVGLFVVNTIWDIARSKDSPHQKEYYQIHTDLGDGHILLAPIYSIQCKGDYHYTVREQNPGNSWLVQTTVSKLRSGNLDDDWDSSSPKPTCGFLAGMIGKAIHYAEREYLFHGRSVQLYDSDIYDENGDPISSQVEVEWVPTEEDLYPSRLYRRKAKDESEG